LTTTVTPIPDPTGESEAFQALLGLCDRRTGSIAPDLLVRHVLSVTAMGGWPVQRAALGRDDGGLAIEAPPEAADGLAALFEGMGRLLREGA
jgi:hypothetical protein